MMEEREEIMRLLPEQLNRDELNAMLQDVKEDLGGGGFLLYKQEIWKNEWDAQIGWLEDETEKPKKAAWCRCSACGDEWHSGWGEGGKLLLIGGEDGCCYPGIPDRDDYAGEYTEGDRVECPCCGEKIELIRKTTLKNGRTYQVMMGQLVNLGRYTTVLFWMLRRHVDRDADSRYDADPWAAIVIGEKKIYRFAHTDMTMFGKRTAGPAWYEQPRMGEPIRQRYYSWGCVNNTCMGGFYRTEVPEMLGTSGEKTGIAAYMQGGGEFPLGYLLRQRRWPGLEALAMSGWVYTMDSAICKEISENYAQGRILSKCFRLEARKPKDMVGMNRGEAARFGRQKWTWEKLEGYRKCEGLSAEDYDRLEKRHMIANVCEAYGRFGAEGLLKVEHYLDLQREKRGLAGSGLRIYLDYLDMLREQNGETETERFPKNIRQAHDRLAAARKLEADKANDWKFAAVREMWAGLEWTDGEICAILPRANRELIEEGRVLNHCVGGYGNTHLQGALILFIRHARRPERSWYTLNIDTKGDSWREIQLHGYKNEMVGGKRLTIPARVRDFVDRWEREVLTPEFQRVKRRKQRTEEAWKTA